MNTFEVITDFAAWALFVVVAVAVAGYLALGARWIIEKIFKH